MEITPLGDSALVVRVTSAAPDADSLHRVLDAAERLQTAKIPGVIELAPAYNSIGVFFDLAGVTAHKIEPAAAFSFLAEQIRKTVSQKASGSKAQPRVMEIPVCYDPEFGFDLEEVARHTGLSPKNVVDLHRSVEYCVACVGFTPGFPFLIGLPAKLATPRRVTPRKEIPPGSVGIGGQQTGIYPVKSPGGWNIIGRTSLRLFDPKKSPPVLLRAGDRVRFRAITRDEFARSTS